MSHTVVKIIKNREDETMFGGVGMIDDYWHLVIVSTGDRATYCQRVFLDGASIEFVTKEVKSGGITCPSCIEEIKAIKGIKL